MPFPILAGKAIVDTGFNVANSCRFNYGDSAYMTKTIGTPSSTTAWTLSMWFKLGSSVRSVAAEGLFTSFTDTNNRLQVVIEGSELEIFGKTGGSTSIYYLTEMKFRDHSAWYHLCIAADTSDGTAADRVKVYLNGVRIEAGSMGSFSTYTQAASNRVFECAVDGAPHLIAAKNTGSIGSYWDGYLAEVVFIDGSQLAPTSFGEFNSDSPSIWQPIDVSGLTFGNNGYYLDFEASDNLGNDANGGTDLSETNVAATDQCTDTPTNNFCTLNPLRLAGVLSEGNCTYTPSATAHTCEGTMGITAGKWYWEVRCSDSSVNLGLVENGISVIGNNDDNYPTYTAVAGTSTTWTIYNNVSSGNNSTTHTGTQVSNSGNDIIMVGFDADNENLYFGVNGTWEPDGADPTSGASATGASITSIQARYGGTLIPIAGVSGAVSRNWDYNFGNPSWGLSSAVNDANGYGNFEFAPPSGYFALCSKNLAEYGG